MLAFAAPASAACTVTGQTIVCGATVTADTTYPTSLGLDRAYAIDTSAGAGSVTLNGAVTGYGLAVLNTVGGANALTVTNNAGVSVAAGNAPSVGSPAALYISTMGATPLTYSGAGDITNNATANALNDGLRIDANGSGDITLNVGGNVTAANAGTYGIWVNDNGTAGNVSVTTAAGKTIAAGSRGIVTTIFNAANAGNTTITNNAAIASSAGGPLAYGINSATNGTGSLAINNTGAIGSSTDRVTLAGISGGITNATSAAPLSITNGAGAIYAGTNGILANNSGTGTTTVTTGTGAVNAVNNGISATGTTGAMTITTGTGAVTASDAAGIGIAANNTTGALTLTAGGAVTGGLKGIQAVSTGAQTFNVNGAVSGTAGSGLHSDTTGTRTINVGTTGSIKGPAAEAILLTNTGGATINNSGTIGTAGTSLALNAATATGPVAVNNGTSSSTAGTLNGRLTFGAGADTLSNYGTWNTQGTTDFGAGADVLNNRSTGTINLTGNTTFANLETFTQGGKLNLNTYTLTGSGAFTNASGATIDTNGAASLAGFTSFSNAGTLDLAAGTFTVPAAAFTNTGTVIADEGASTITGQTSFVNNGTISLQDGATGDVLTINSSYNGGAGSVLAVDATPTASDRLVVNGAISGSTAVDANILDVGALIGGTGVQVVDGLTTSTADAFTLGNVTGASGLVNYSIVQNGADYYLVAGLSQAGFQPVTVGSIVPDLWYPSADEVIANLAVPYKGEGFGSWIDGYVGRDKYGDHSYGVTLGGAPYVVDEGVKVRRLGIQGGIDFGMGGTGRIGITAGYNGNRVNGVAELDATGWNIGAYGSFGGPIGFHGEALIKHDSYKITFRGGVLDQLESRVKANGIDGSIGYRMGMGGTNSSLDVSAGLSHVWNKIDGFAAYGLRYDYRDLDSTRGRASVRYNLGGDLQPYVQGTIYHEFQKKGSVVINDGVNDFFLDNYNRGTWGRIEAGLGGTPSRFPSFGAWVDLGDVKGLGARVGFRFGGHAEAPPPPPPVEAPPPPPEPAPATQTCYDGSVILATDTCPTPPPPPPPPPAPERG